MRRTDTDVVVVGAGAAGLAAAAALRREGVGAVVLEASERPGSSWSRRYDRLRLHTVRRFSGLPYRSLPKSLPRYVTKDEYAEYLADYAIAEGLDVRTRRRVGRIARDDGLWFVEADGETWRARAVVVATGKHNLPRRPRWEGIDRYAGRLLHSAEYGAGDEFRGLRTLVVGLGNSGAEIAADLAESGASFVAVSVRTSPPIVRREFAGIPVQLLGMALMPFPARPVDRLGAAVRRVGVGDLSKYGLGKAAWGPFEERRPPVIDVGFLAALKRREVHVRPAVVRLTERGAQFADGSEEDFDAIVAATGFTSGLEEILDVPVVVDEHGQPRSGTDRLYFVGFVESARGALFESNRAARRVARELARSLA